MQLTFSRCLALAIEKMSGVLIKSSHSVSGNDGIVASLTAVPYKVFREVSQTISGITFEIAGGLFDG